MTKMVATQLYVETHPPVIWTGKKRIWMGRNMGGWVKNEGAKKVFQNHTYC